MRRAVLLLLLAFGVSTEATLGCAHEAPTAAPPQTSAAAPDVALARVAEIHGNAGPWAVAGYRMGLYALAKLGLPRQSFDLDVTHRTPASVQYSCIADGAAAATGASMGKLNLHVADAAAADVETVYRRKSTGVSIALRPTAAFAARFKDVPYERFDEASREVLALPGAEVFEEVGATGASR
jgi:formylmethanofuran dehydrogenase subunit E